MTSPKKRQFEARETPTPGPRTEITVRLAVLSLPDLIDGVDVRRMWLTDEGNDVYGLHAHRTLGQARKDEPTEPAIDVLVRGLNRFLDVYYDHEDAIPAPVKAAMDRCFDEYEARLKPLDAFVIKPAEDGGAP
jgi:hypothetical protein